MNYKLFIVCFVISAAVWGEEKPCMPVGVYRFYRAWNKAEGSPFPMNSYRPPTEDEKRKYLYGDYRETMPGDYSVATSEPDMLVLRQICRWLIKDDPEVNIPFISSYIKDMNQQFQSVCDQDMKTALERKIGNIIVPLIELSPNPLDHLVELINADSEASYVGMEWGVKALFERYQNDRVEIKRCLNILIDEAINSDDETKKIVLKTLFHLHQQELICLSFIDIAYIFEEQLYADEILLDCEYLFRTYYSNKWNDVKGSIFFRKGPL